ncbi:MAG TPA: ATP-binding cassette domain-containing protein [Oceanipulchritudo sp.]|nr:ATP-binding cassette domain-containing protein [Oceanipulchritudo sp.]
MESTVTVEPVPVRIENLSKSFGPQVVLNGVSLEVKPGQIFVLMGPSGSGKSVLLRQVIGLESPDSGQVLIGDQPAHIPETHDTYRTALVFQAGALFNSMTVYDNLALHPREHRLYNESVIREKVTAVMRALSIENAGNKIPAELSGGMKKRVAVARAIIMEPQLILYDEPTSELDPILAATTIELIATIARETGATSLVVTHDRALALNIADQVALLMNGQLVFNGSPDELRGTTDPRVQEFMNPSIDPKNPRFRKKENNA